MLQGGGKIKGKKMEVEGGGGKTTFKEALMGTQAGSQPHRGLCGGGRCPLGKPGWHGLQPLSAGLVRLLIST